MPDANNVNLGVNSETAKAAVARQLVDAMTLAYHRLTQVAADLHGLTAGERAVLLTLEARGPASISDLAKARDVSRQFMQRLVAQLAAKGWVVERANPRHRRSPLIAPSETGLGLIGQIHAAETPLWQAFAGRFKASELDGALRILRALSDFSPSP